MEVAALGLRILQGSFVDVVWYGFGEGPPYSDGLGYSPGYGNGYGHYGYDYDTGIGYGEKSNNGFEESASE